VRFLLDTHVFLWWLQDHRALSAVARAALSDPKAQVAVSAVSIWEIAIKASLGKLSLRGIAARDLGELPSACGFEGLPFSTAAAAEVLGLPFHHHDPFDRALIGQARVESLVLVTHDAAIAAYEVQTMRI
jgi:PIN domain nuclease of toxin-antitoxin system